MNNDATSDQLSLVYTRRVRKSAKGARQNWRHCGVGGRARRVRKTPLRLAVCTTLFVTLRAAPHPKMDDYKPNLAELLRSVPACLWSFYTQRHLHW